MHDPIQAITFALTYFSASLKGVVYAVHNKIQSPIGIGVSSILSTLSSAAQGHVDVETTYGSRQPTSLYTLTVAESGERKTSTDKEVAAALFEQERRLLEYAKEREATYKVERECWLARRRNARRQLTKAFASGCEVEISLATKLLREVLELEPTPPNLCRSLLSDATPAALSDSLAGNGKAVTLHSSEGGNVLSKTNTDLISNANLIWDGEDVVISRKAGDVIITGGRLTLSLMVQPAVLDHIYERKGELLRLSGFYARALVTYPPSTQGHRFGDGESELDAKYLEQFQARVDAIQRESMHYQGHQERVLLRFSPQARQYMLQFGNDVEMQLSGVGFFSDVKEAASKIANNASRIAALLHVYEHGVEQTEISGEIARAACALADYYLLEYKRLFGIKTIAEQAKEYGELLLAWLQRNYQQSGFINPTRTHILQYGPNKLRKRERLELALQYLVSIGEVQYYPQAKPASVQYPLFYQRPTPAAFIIPGQPCR